MRKLLKIALLGTLLFSCGSSSKPLYTSAQIQQIQKTYYKKGYEEGYKKAFAVGYIAKEKEIENNIEKWKRDIKAVEVGKHAIKKGIIPFPKVYRAVQNGMAQIVIEGEDISPDSLDALAVLDVPFLYSQNSPVNYELPQPSAVELNSLNPIEKVAFINGFNEGVKKGFQDGQKKAKKDAVESLSEPIVKKKILALEVDKYINSELMITAPRIYRIINGNSVNYLIIPSKVEKVRKPEDIVDGKDIPVPNAGIKTGERSLGITLPPSSTPVILPSTEPSKIIKVEIPCGRIPLLEKLGIDYEISDSSCRAVFFDEGQKESFCKEYGICREGN